MGIIWTREESCVWDDGVSIRGGIIGCGVIGWVGRVGGSGGVKRG